MKRKQWFGIRGLFLHKHRRSAVKDRYDESIIILRAGSEQEAEKAAKRVFKRNEDVKEGVRFLNKVDICPVFERPGENKEVFWFTRISELSPTRYIRKYWDDGKLKSCDEKGWDHVWYNINGKISGCYNCYEERKGQLWKPARSGPDQVK